MQRSRLTTVSQEPEDKDKEKEEKPKDKEKQEEAKDDKDKDKQKVDNNDNYEDIPQLVTIDEIKKPIISKQRKNDLKEKLELQKESLAKVRERQKTNNLILSYDRNLFMQQSYLPLNKGERDIVGQVLELQNSTIFSDFQQTRKRFRQQMGQQLMTFQKIKSTIGKNTIKLRQDPPPQQSKQKKEQKKQQQKKPQQIKLQKRQASWLDDLPKTAMEIYKYTQQNIYLKKEKGLNIFREARNAVKNNQTKQNFLQECHFIEKSVSQSFNISTIKIDTFKHLSLFARLLAANKEQNIKHGTKLHELGQKPEDYLYDVDVTYDLNNLNYRTLMNIASGRFTSSFFATAQLGIEDIPSVTPDQKKQLSLSEKSQTNIVQVDDGYVNQGWETNSGNMDEFYKDCMIKAPLLDTQKKTKVIYKKLLKQIQIDSKKKQADLIRRIYQKQQQTQQRSISMDRLQSFKGNRYSYKQIKKLHQDNKKIKTKEDQFWLQSFEKALKMQIQTADQLQKIRRQSIFY